MVLRSDGSGVLIDLAVNAPPDLPASATPAGPTLAPEELTGNKLLALFDRAAARDFADIARSAPQDAALKRPASYGRALSQLPSRRLTAALLSPAQGRWGRSRGEHFSKLLSGGGCNTAGMSEDRNNSPPPRIQWPPYGVDGPL